MIKVPNAEVSGLFKNCVYNLVQSLDTSLIEMEASSSNYWLSEFAQLSSERYPPRTVYGIVAGVRRFHAEKKPGDDLNMPSTSDNR